MKSTFKVLFYLKKGSEKKNGEVYSLAANRKVLHFYFREETFGM